MNDPIKPTAPGLAVVMVVAALLLLLTNCSEDSAISDGETVASAAAPIADAEAVEAAPITGTEPAEAVPIPSGNPEMLSEWGQLEARDGQLILGEGVVPYSLNSALFSDYAHKLRTVRLPDGAEPAAYRDEEAFDFPIGTIITKTFYFPTEEPGPADELRVMKVAAAPERLGELDLAAVRLLETRILVRHDDGWAALPYVWNDDETEATLQRTGALVNLTLVDAAAETPFVYVVPDVNQCANCHATNHTTKAIEPIGLKARHLQTDVDLGDGSVSQLQYWQTHGLLGPAPAIADIPRAAVWDDDEVSLDDRARAYLDINCSHCHNQAGSADTSALYLEASTPIGTSLGVCKAPIAAGTGTGGRLVGIHPGEPEDSIFVYRMETLDPGAMMPELGRSLTHVEGVDLISAWIESLVGSC